MINNKHNYLLSDLKEFKGVGSKTYNILKKKKLIIFLIFYGDFLNLISTEVNLLKSKILKVGEDQTITLVPYKYNFPRIRNLPSRVYCRDETGEMECVFFNSYEGYIKKILPLNTDGYSQWKSWTISK